MRVVVDHRDVPRQQRRALTVRLCGDVRHTVHTVYPGIDTRQKFRYDASQGTRKVATRAIITETTAESSADSAELYKEFERLLVDYQFSYKVGDRVTGKVFHCDAKGAWVDIGAKAAALCPGSEASLAQARNVSTSSTPV